MEMAMEQHQEKMSRAKRLVRQQRLELFETQRRLEQFAHPQDSYDLIDEEDAHLDMQIRAYRTLARQSNFA